MPSNGPQTPAPETDPEKKLKGPGEKPVSFWGIIALAAYLIVLTIFLLHGTVQLLKVDPSLQGQKPAETAPGESLQKETPSVPADNPSKSDPNSAKKEVDCWKVRFWFIGVVSVSKELQLILIVIFAGALGSLVHALRSLSWYVGNRQLMVSWIAMYGLLPFMGASLAVVFYLVIRGGFFSAQTGSEQVNLFGFAAVAGLVGMFSEQALLKLKDVAETLFTQGEQGNDPVELKDQKPQNPPSAGDASGAKTGDAEKKGNPAPSPADAQPDRAPQNPKS